MVTAQVAQNQPSVPFQPSSTARHTANIPTGSNRATISTGHTHPSARHQFVEEPPGQTGLDEVPVAEQHGVGQRTEERRPRPAFAAKVRVGGVPAASTAAANRPIIPMNAGARSSTGWNSGRPARRHRRWRHDLRSMPVIAATRAQRRSCSARAPETPACLRRIETPSAEQQRLVTPTEAPRGPARPRTTARPRGSRQRIRSTCHAATSRTRARDPAACREPAEQHTADRPLQEHGGSVEADHAHPR